MSSFIDSNVFIYAATKSKHASACRTFLETTTPKTINTLVLLEVYCGILKITADSDYAVRVSKSIMARKEIHVIAFDSNLFFETLKRISRLQSKFNDAAHFVSAIVHNCSQIVSYDTDFDHPCFQSLPRHEPK